MRTVETCCYEIRIGGRLSGEWSDWLDGLTIQGQPDGTTLMWGAFPDQAALLGLLGRLHGLNLTLISVVRAEDENRPAGGVRTDPPHRSCTHRKPR